MFGFWILWFCGICVLLLVVCWFRFGGVFLVRGIADSPWVLGL